MVDQAPKNSAVFALRSGESSSHTFYNWRHDLVEAQVDVLRMYLEKKSSEQLLEALNRLIDCTRVSFREEEDLMEYLSMALDPAHRDMHNAVLAQLELLRRSVTWSDRGRLLAQLILVDRQLSSHLSEVVHATQFKSARLSEIDPESSAIADNLAHNTI